MKPDDEERRSMAQRRAVQSTGGWQRACDLARELGRARYVPALGLLARVWRHALIMPLRTAAGHALFDLGTPEAHAALQDALEDAEPHSHLPAFLAIKSIVATGPHAAFDRLAPFIDRRDRTIAYEALRFFGPSAGSTAKHWLPVIPDLLRSDRRWIRTAVSLRRDRDLGAVARGLLGSLTSAEIDEALRETPDPAPRELAAYEGPHDLTLRYQRGEHAAVWTWIRTPGFASEPNRRAEAAAVADLTMQRVRRNIERITDRLRAGGYPFDGSVPSWTPPRKSVAEDVSRIEEAIGGSVPLTLRAFWMTVGAVHWKFTDRSEAPSVWRGLPLREADPLCVLGPADAWFAIDEWQQERTLAHPEVVGLPCLQLAADYLHKANISGGATYGFTLPSEEVDPEFENEAHALPFVDYLRLALRWGGFPRLEGESLNDEGRRTLADLVQDLESF
jgi:hypothetical protein